MKNLKFAKNTMLQLWEMRRLDSGAVTKIQSAAIISVFVFTAFAGTLAYILWSSPAQHAELIKIGVSADIDNAVGKGVLQAAILAAEQVNAEGGVLGRNFTIVTEDDDTETPPGDVAVATNAFTKLVTVDNAEYIVAASGNNNIKTFQDLAADHKRILLSVYSSGDEITQRVSDNYDRYRYFFKVWPPNSTSVCHHLVNSLIALKDYSGFTKVALLGQGSSSGPTALTSMLNNVLPQNGFDIVYNDVVLYSATDFTSQFAAMKAAGAEVLVPIIVTQAGSFLVNEWFEQQAPFVVWGIVPIIERGDSWNLTGGKCEYVSSNGLSVAAGYPFTDKSLPTKAAFIQRWGTPPLDIAVAAYDAVRFILPEAIRRAGTTETQTVAKALESIDVETSMARHFAFTPSHDLMMTFAEPSNPAALDEGHVTYMTFQWQNGTQVPVYPEEILKKAGAIYKYPPWDGPWR